MIPAMGMEVPQIKLDSAIEDLNNTIKVFEDVFLQDKSFIIGEHISLADLVAIVEIMQVTNIEIKSFHLTSNIPEVRLKIFH